MSWEKIPGWTDGHLHEIYEQAVRDAPADKPSRFAEVGVAFGRSAGLMATRIVESGKPIRMLCVDSWLVDRWEERNLNELIDLHGGFFEAFEGCLAASLTAEQRKTLTIKRADSVDAASKIEPASLDFVFIDGAHDEASVARDVAAWAPLVRPGGVMAGHDHTPGHPGVERAVRAAFGNAYEVRGSCWWRRMP